MKYLAAALTYLGFFALIGGTCYALHSGWPLLALVCMPSFKFNVKEESEAQENIG